MSLIYTESFGAFAKSSVSDAWDTGAGQGNAVRENYRLALIRAGYQVAVSANNSKDTSGGFIVRNDPVYPERWALCHSSDVTPGVANQYSAAFRKKLPVTEKQIIVGFSVYVPAEYVPNNTSSTVAVLRCNAALLSDANWYQQGITVASAKECFRVCNDLSLRWGTDAAQSSKKLSVGAVNYLEMRISAGEVSVWIDDVFVMQKVVSLMPETIAFCFENNTNSGAGGTQIVGNAGRWAIGNMYYILNDGQAPTVRLGPTTRVLPQRPDQDIDVRFIKPSAAASNSAVAAQDLVDSPPWQLQSTTVGDFDTYTNNDAAMKATIGTMGMVHAVCTKTLAANLEPDVHKIRPYVKGHLNATEAADNRPREMVQLNSPTVRAIKVMALRPTDNAIVIAGDGEMCFISGPNGDTSTWTQLSQTAAAFNINAIWPRSDGALLLGGWSGSGNAKLYFHTNAGGWLIGTSTFGSSGPGSFIMSPDGATLRGFYYANPSGTSGTTGGGYSLAGTTANGAAPQNASWTAYGGLFNTPAPTNLNSGAIMRQKPDGSMTMALVGAAETAVWVSTAANGGTYVGRTHGDASTFYSALTWDGTAWLIAGTSNDATLGSGPRVRRSADGISWAAATPIGNSQAGADSRLRHGISNLTTQQSMFVGDNGAMIMSNDGINWRQLPRMTTQHLRAGVCLPNGDFVVGGDGGVLLRFTDLGKDTALYPLAGYNMAFGSAVINPVTATAWTPAEAADSDFGVRLTS